MRIVNPEWDFMGRTFLVLALANQALALPDLREGHLQIMDAVIRDTVETDEWEGLYHFLMPYARHGRWVADPPRSVFVDGEIALMLGARRLVEESAPWAAEMARRLAFAEAAMGQSPLLVAESYPDECWMFCNAVAIAAMAVAEALEPAGATRSSTTGWTGRGPT